jgi:hypothetical protein
MSIYSTKDAFDTYVYYLALKRHFTTNYDFFKYNGKVRASVDSFENRKDKYHFYKLSKRSDNRDFILANLIHDPGVWIGNLFNEGAENIYKDWKKNQQSLMYIFKQDINNLDENFDSNLVVHDGNHPKLLRLHLSRQIGSESLIMINEVTGVFNYWDKKLVDKILWPDIKNKCIKYRPFLSLDNQKIKSTILSTFSNT